MASSAHFSDAELRCPHCLVNGCTQALLDALEALRATVGQPILVDSAYRCPAHNGAILNDAGQVISAKSSQHILGNAADIRVAGMSAGDLEQAAQKIPAFSAGGIGRNDHAGFIHVDVREHFSRWCYNSDGSECAYYPPA